MPDLTVPLDPLPTGDRPSPPWREPALLAAGALVLLRLLYLPWINLFPEEAYYWNYAQHLDIGYLDHPPMVAWLIALGAHTLGQTETGVRVCAVLCSLVTSGFAYRLGALLYGRRAGAAAALLSQILPFFFMAGWMMTPDAPLAACWAAMLYYLARVLVADSARAWWGVGLCLGLGMLSKYTVALLGPATLVFLFLDARSRRWFLHPLPYLSVGLAAAVFSPVIAWNARHSWASFTFQSTGRLAQAARFSFPELLGSVLLLLTPVGVALAVRAWRRRQGGTMAVLDHDRRRWLFGWTFTLVPLGVFVVFSLTHRVKLNWTGPLWLALLPALAAQVAALVAPAAGDTLALGRGVRALRSGVWATAAILGALYLGLLQYLGTGLPGVPPARNILLLPVGWPQMGRELSRQLAEVRQQSPGTKSLIIGMDRDFIASEVAFYQPAREHGEQDVTGAHLFGNVALMYEYWTPRTAQDGATLVMASFNPNWLDADEVHRFCGRLDEPREHVIERGGKTVCRYYTRVGYDYKAAGYFEPVTKKKTRPAKR